MLIYPYSLSKSYLKVCRRCTWISIPSFNLKFDIDIRIERKVVLRVIFSHYENIFILFSTYSYASLFLLTFKCVTVILVWMEAIVMMTIQILFVNVLLDLQVVFASLVSIWFHIYLLWDPCYSSFLFSVLCFMFCLYYCTQWCLCNWFVHS